MPTELGHRVKSRRNELGIGVRELARRIEKSPAFITILENDENPPSATEDTLSALARELKLDAVELITLAGKTPRDVIPTDALEGALYRQVKRMTEDGKRLLLDELRGRT